MGEVEEGCSSQIPPGSVEPSLQQAVLWPIKDTRKMVGVKDTTQEAFVSMIN